MKGAEKTLSLRSNVIFLILISSISLWALVDARKAKLRQKVQYREQSKELAETKQIVSLLQLRAKLKDEIESPDQFEIAIELRNKIYSAVPIKNSRLLGADTFDPKQEFSDAIHDSEVGHLCGGMALIYMSALEALGIPARYVRLFASNGENPDSHVTVEFLHDGKWHASDPTFNVMFKKDGQFLSYLELGKLIKSNESYDVVSNGFEFKKGRELENYYINYDDLFEYVIIHPSVVNTSEGRKNFELILLPESWDGTIGGEKQSGPLGGVYRLFSEGPLR